MSALQWIIVAIITGVIEIFTVGFWFLWLALAALIVALGTSLALLPNLESQLLVFAIFTLIFIIFTRPLVLRFIKTEETISNVKALVGQYGLTLTEVSPLQYGQAKVNGEIWTVYSDDEIPADKRVKVIGVEGVKLKVEAANSDPLK